MHVCLRQRTARISEYVEQKRLEQNEFNLRSGKSEAEVLLIIEDCGRRDRHEASRGLSGTAELLFEIEIKSLLLFCAAGSKPI